MKIQIIFMVAMETKIIIVTMTAKQPHFASSENVTSNMEIFVAKRKFYDFSMI
jgi:hypothetical protein